MLWTIGFNIFLNILRGKIQVYLNNIKIILFYGRQKNYEINFQY